MREYALAEVWSITANFSECEVHLMNGLGRGGLVMVESGLQGAVALLLGERRGVYTYASCGSTRKLAVHASLDADGRGKG